MFNPTNLFGSTPAIGYDSLMSKESGLRISQKQGKRKLRK